MAAGKELLSVVKLWPSPSRSSVSCTSWRSWRRRSSCAGSPRELPQTRTESCARTRRYQLGCRPSLLKMKYPMMRRVGLGLLDLRLNSSACTVVSDRSLLFNFKLIFDSFRSSSSGWSSPRSLQTRKGNKEERL